MPVFAQPFEALLFDMDGTILSSIPAVERAWSGWALRVGVPVEAVLHHMHGRPARDTIAHFARPGLDVAQEVAWLDARELEDLDGILAIPGAAELLAALPHDRWAVVTSANRALADRRIRAAGLPVPPLLITSDEVARGKPDPEGYLMAARQLGVRPDLCLVFEDTVAGINAGQAAGAEVVRMLGTPGAGFPTGIAAIASYRGLGLTVTEDGVALDFAATEVAAQSAGD
jgi:mannitol-1-/sugar-/sorbitol-6-phosphatase